MFRPAPVLTAVALVAVSGLAHGLVTARWQRSDALENALARVALVPRDLGTWKAADLPTDPEVFAQAGAEAYWMRRYENAATSQAVTVILMCGLPGPLSVHTPDVCYRGAGYEMAGSARTMDVPVAGATANVQLWSADFRQETVGGSSQLRLFWTWSADGAWSAPTVPRLAFAGQPALFKLYLVRELVADEPLQSDATLGLLDQLVPALNDTLFRPDRRAHKEL